MKRIKVLVINAVILMVTSLIMRTVGMSFQVYLSNKMGSAGIGLFQLIMSIYILALTFALSGIRLTATRLVAEELAIGNVSGARKSMRYCIIYSQIFSITASVILFFSAGYIGVKWLGDERTVLSLKMVSFCLPFLSATAVLNGYFTAVRRALHSASIQIIEQIIEIVVIVACFAAVLHKGIEYACASIIFGYCLGEIASTILLIILYRLDVKRFKTPGGASKNILGRMLSIALPVALSAYLTSGIRTLQQLIIPYGLKKSGASSESVLSTYGLILGMVMPILMFPSVFLDTVSEIIIPELAECRARGNTRRENYIVSRVFNLGMMVSICVMCIFFRYSGELSLKIYKSYEAAYFIKVLSPIIPVMYMDSIVDSMLKGIGEQVSSMRYNIIESSLSVIMLLILLPRIAIWGYIITFYITRGLNFSLSVNRLVKKINLKINLYTMAKALLCIFLSLTVTGLVFLSSDTSLWFVVSFAVLIYFIMLRITVCITHEDFVWFKSIFK